MHILKFYVYRFMLKKKMLQEMVVVVGMAGGSAPCPHLL